MPTKLQRLKGRHSSIFYDAVPEEYTGLTEPLTAYTEAEEAAHIREIVSLALKNVSPIDLGRFTHEELVDRTIRAMGSAIASKGCSE